MCQGLSSLALGGGKMRDPGNEVVSGKCGFDRNDKWYNHVPESVLENENYKLLWDFSIRADHHIEARRPNLMLVKKKQEKLSYNRRSNTSRQ